MLDSETTLVQRAQAGERAAFEELVRRTSRLVYARLFLETGDTHLAEDLLQETLLIAFRTIGHLTHADRFRAWLLRIAQNAAIDAARRKMAQQRMLENRMDVQRESPNPAEKVEQDEVVQKLLVILRSMPEEYRLPLTLHYLVGADHETIQMQMGLTNGSLRGLLHRGMERMRGEMQKLLGEDYPH